MATSSANTSDPVKVGILTVSDSCFQGRAHDRSGDNLKDLIDNGKQLRAFVKVKDIVPDEQEQIKDKLLEWCYGGLDLVLTTGGTGFSPRDVTPEATRAVVEKEAPGLTLAMLKGSLDITPLAMLSRPVCGIRKKTLIINLPGSKKGSQECLELVMPALPHALDLITDRKSNITETHTQLQAQGVATRGQHGQHGCGRHHSHTHHHGNKEDKHGHHGNHHHHGKKHEHRDETQVDTSRVARRHRESPYPIISVQEAVSTVLQEADVCATEEVNYKESLGRILAEDVYAKDALPPFPASIKDGYAVIASDGAGSRKVLGDSTAGSVPVREVTPGTCVRISTGAPLPPGADAVIQVEDTELTAEGDDGRTELEITLLSAPTQGQDIRPVGSDISAGEHVLSSGVRLGPSELGLLATTGVIKVKCHRRPTIGVMSTGNELVDPDEPLSEGKIRDSNRTTLQAVIRDHGYTPLDLGIARDTAQALLEQVKKALDKVDIIVTSGGVSMGEKDLIKDVLCVDLNAKVHFGRVLMKPGKPTTFATVEYNGKKKLFFGLPGNPVSATVTCNLYVIPVIRKMSGEAHPERTIIKAKLSDPIRLDPRPEYHRCSLYWAPGGSLPLAVSTGNQLSSRLLSLRAANGLIVLPARNDEVSRLEKDAEVDVMIIGAL